MPETVTTVSRFTEQGGDQETVTSRAERVTRIVANSDRPVTPSEEDSIRGNNNRSAAAASPDGDGVDSLDENSSKNVTKNLAQIERRLKAEAIPNSELPDLWAWLSQIAEQYQGNEGDRIGGWAKRLAEDVGQRWYGNDR